MPTASHRLPPEGAARARGDRGPRERVRWGILGTAGINRKLLAGAALSNDVEVVAVASRDLVRATAYAAEAGIPRAFGSYEDLLGDPTIEAVYVSLPNALHHRWTLAALAAGKHVLCEKPYSRHPDDVAEAFDAADRSGRLLAEGFMWRHTPQARKLLELLPEIGELRTIRATFAFRIGEGENIRLRSDLEGGALMDVGCYCVSGARLLTGEEPRSVFGIARFGPEGVDMTFTGVLDFPGGATAEFSSSFAFEHQGLEAIGSRGSIRVPDPWHSREGRLFLDDREIRVEPINPYQLELENLSTAIRGEGTPLLGRADALGQARAIAALYDSAERGVAVRP